ncbi:MAG: 5'-nucleotidase, partial [Myxococcota bacterium]
GLSGEQILYVGDHAYSDVRESKNVRRWRTALVLRELEQELPAQDSFVAQQDELSALMAEKVVLEQETSEARILLQRVRDNYGPPPAESIHDIEIRLSQLRPRLLALDAAIAPLAAQSGQLNNQTWGLLMRAGNDKSHLARQVERHADIYMSRVSNMLYATPFVYLRSRRGSLPHDFT